MNKQRRHPDTNAFQGLSGAGFALREDDAGGLSVTWVEYFGQESPSNIQSAAIAYRESLTSKRLGSEGLFAAAVSAEVIAASALREKSVRVVHAPVPGNDGHAEVRHFTDEDLELLDLLAVDAFTEIHFVRDLALPKRLPPARPS